MTTLRKYVFGCVADRSQEAVSHAHRRSPKVKFGVLLGEACKGDCLPRAIVDILIYLARQGVTTSDLFRRPGNPTDLKTIIKRLTEGKEIVLTNYNFYTLASVLKKFLLKIPGGLFGSTVEEQLLSVLDIPSRMEQYDEIHRIILSLSTSTQHLLSLLCGTWFRIVNHFEFNSMSAEAVAKSVAGSLFHTCADDPTKVEKAVNILEVMIDDFGVANMFGHKNIQYFADKTRTGIRVTEKFRYEYRYPPDNVVPYENSLRLFMIMLQQESRLRGFLIEKHAISEQEFYGSVRSSQENQQKAVEICQPPSPQSLQPSGAYQRRRLTDPNQKLTNVSSISAPEVHRCSPNQDSRNPNKAMFQSVSLSRFDQVKRKQMMRMKKRSNWFLMTNASTAVEAESMQGSRDMSVGKSSVDAISSDALMSDVSASDAESDVECSDAACSDGACSDAARLSDADSSFMEEINNGVTPASEPIPRRVVLVEPETQANCADPEMTVKTTSPKEGRYLQESHLTEREVRYFMVENWYGAVEDES